MQIEAFSQGKVFLRSEDNEDSFIVIPGIGYAVIDGVTDHNGTYFGDVKAGRFASQTIKCALGEYLLSHQDSGSRPSPQDLVRHLSRRLREAYERYGQLEHARNDMNRRAGCAFTVAIHAGDNLDIVALGDAGIRLNGDQVHQMAKPLDMVTSLMRREAWNLFTSEGSSELDSDALSASINRYGLDHQTDPRITDERKTVIRESVLAAFHQMFQAIPQEEVEHLIANGIAHGQRRFSNKTDLELGYGLLDGFDVPDRHILHLTFPAKDIEQIELFSDGYFKCGSGFGISSWEEAFREVEDEDPHKIGPYMSTKGTTSLAYTDDRTYLGIRF